MVQTAIQRAKARSYGAISVVSALFTWKGAALGVDLKCDAEVELYPDERSIVEIVSNNEDKHSLVEHCVRQTFQKLGVKKKSARVRIDSQIPVAKGLKSSSATSNAVVLATIGALKNGKPGRDDMRQVLNIGVDASLASKASLTGAYDDASACLLGGLVITNNKTRKLEKRIEVDERTRVLIYLPKGLKFTSDIDPSKLKPFTPLSLIAYDLVFDGNYFDAMNLNGLVQSTAFGYSKEAITKAMVAGAKAAGLSGKGPAVAALCYDDNVGRVIDSWRDLDGSVVQCNVNNKLGGLLE